MVASLPFIKLSKVLANVDQISNFQLLFRFLLHGMASGLCLYKARSAVKYFAAVSLTAHAAFPAVRCVLSKIASQDWNLAFNKIRQILDVFREEELLWKSIRSLYQEINLVARGAVL